MRKAVGLVLIVTALLIAAAFIPDPASKTGSEAISTGAVAAIKPGTLYDTLPYGKPVGAFAAGEQWCAQLVTTGEDNLGFLMLQNHSGKGYVFVHNTPDTFEPGTRNKDCQGVALFGEVARPSLLHSIRKAVTAINLSEQTRAATMTTTEILLLMAGVGIWRWQMTRKPKISAANPGRPVQRDVAQAVYPGFEIKTGDFEVIGSDEFRVNSDGVRVNLKPWEFNVTTGEFDPVAHREPIVILQRQGSYAERLTAYYSFRRGRQIEKALGLIFWLVTVGLLELAISQFFAERGRPSGTYLGIAALFTAPFPAYVAKVFSSGSSPAAKADRVGPQPLLRLAPAAIDHQFQGATEAETI